MTMPEWIRPARMVRHSSFGEGLIDTIADPTVTVHFRSVGLKNVLFSHLAPVYDQPPVKEPQPVRFRVISAADFADQPRPRREFLDGGDLIPRKNVTLLYGDGGTGKSLLALQLACGVTVTGQWLGLNVRRGGVLYFSAEDDEDETHIRMAEIAEADGFALSEADDLRIAVMAGEDALLATEDARSSTMEWTPLFLRLRAELDSMRPQLLIIDNLADVFGGNENVKTLARQFISKLRSLAIQFECSVLVLAHPSLSGMSSGTGTSGNTAWSNSSRSRLYFEREIVDQVEANPDRRILKTMKSNYGRTGGTIIVEWQSGRFLNVEPKATTANPFEHMAKTARAERVFLEMVRRFNRQNRPLSPSRSSAYAPTLFARHQLAEGVKMREFEQAMNILFERGEIAVEIVGPPSKRRQNIVVRSGQTDEPGESSE